MTSEYNNSDVLLKIASFAKLAVGWSYGEGGPIPQDTLRMAKQIAVNLITTGFTKTDAFPGLSGEARVTAYEGDRYFEFTVEADQSITVLYEVNSEEVEYMEGMKLNSVTKKIREYRSLCESCVPSTKSTMMRTASDSNPSRLNRRLTAAGFQLSSETAHWQPAQIYAATSINSITPSSGIRRYTGFLTQTSSLPNTIYSKRPAAQVIFATAT